MFSFEFGLMKDQKRYLEVFGPRLLVLFHMLERHFIHLKH